MCPALWWVLTGNYGAHELNRAETWKEPTQPRNGSPMTQHLCFWPHPGNLDTCSPGLSNHVYSNALKITQGESDSQQPWRGRREHCYVLRPCSGSGSTRCASSARHRKTQALPTRSSQTRGWGGQYRWTCMWANMTDSDISAHICGPYSGPPGKGLVGYFSLKVENQGKLLIGGHVRWSVQVLQIIKLGWVNELNKQRDMKQHGMTWKLQVLG